METQSQFLNDDLLPPVRSTFLTVLCILTFVGSGYGIFSGITTLTGAAKIIAQSTKNMDPQKQQAERQRLSEKKDGGSKFALKMMDSVGEMMNEKKIKQTGIATIISSLLTLGGALLMWRLNRTGFYIYVAGILTGVAAPFIIYGSDAFVAIMSAAVSGFFGLLFIVLYAFNLKDMQAKTVG